MQNLYPFLRQNKLLKDIILDCSRLIKLHSSPQKDAFIHSAVASCCRIAVEEEDVLCNNYRCVFMWVCQVSNSPRSIPKGLAQKALSLKHSEVEAEIGNVDRSQRKFDVILSNNCLSRQSSRVLKRQVERPHRTTRNDRIPIPGANFWDQ